MLPIALGSLHDSFGGYGAGLTLAAARRRRRVRRREPGARRLASRLGRHRRSPRVMVKTGCPYCGVGCGLVAEVRDGRLTAVRGDEAHPVNRGRTCRKPLALPEAVTLRRPRAETAAPPLPGRALPRRDLGRGARPRRHPPAAVQAGGDRVLHLRPAADRGLLRGQQARQGLPGDEQRRLQLAPVHVERRGRVRRDVRLRRPAARLRRHRAGEHDPPAGQQHQRLPPDPVGPHPRRAGGGRDADRRRPAPHRQRRRRRHPPADQAGHGPRAAERVHRRPRARGRLGCDQGRRGLRRAGGGDRARRPRVRRRPRLPRDVVDGRQPVDRGRRDQPRAAEPVRRDRPDRPSGRRSALAHGPAERDGRPRDRRPGAPAAGLPQGRA